jgi:hypothetical protein
MDAHLPTCRWPAARRQALRSGLGAAALLLALGLARPATWAPVAQAQVLTDGLLTAADLPAGWSVSGPLDADAGVPFACPALPAPAQPLAQVGELLVGTAPTEMAYQTVGQYGPGEAAQVLAAALHESEPCIWTAPLDAGPAASLAMAPATGLPLGEEAAERPLVMQGEGFVVTGELVLLRCGDTLTQLTHLVVGPEVRVLDTAAQAALAQAAAQRLSQAVVGDTAAQCVT